MDLLKDGLYAVALTKYRGMPDKWTHDLESGGQNRQIDAIYTDFEKAFDKVPHKRLLNKIRCYGFPRELTNWIDAFLLGRKYRVSVNGKFSYWYSVISGIPQGSVWDHFYLYYILMIWQTWIQVITGQTDIYLFADDAKICRYITCRTYRRLPDLAGDSG